MNKIFTTQTYKKASLTACLFFCLICQASPTPTDHQWVFDDVSKDAYALVLNLQFADAVALLPEPSTAQEHYVVGLAEALELLLTEDAEKFSEYEKKFETRIHKKIKGNSLDYKFLRAELHLQWAFVYLKFGKELDAASHLREAYHISVACRRKAPRYLAIQKTTGLLEIVIGSVPSKYNWVLSFLNMEGTIPLGIQELTTLRDSESALAFEADLLLSIAQGYVFQKPEVGFAELKRVLLKKPANRLALFTGASLAIKDSQSEQALGLLNSLSENTSGVSLDYSAYLKGEVFLHKGEYINAISSYRWFITHYKGKSNLKDAYFKIGLCYLLNGNTNDAMDHFEKAKDKGKESVEADKSAARTLSDKTLPNIPLSKARYSMDGGYYDEAREVLSGIKDKDLPDRKSQVEYYYRKARLEHKTNQVSAAKLFYNQVIDMAGESNWYFAPNSCLQMGYLLIAESDPDQAKTYFQKALGYPNHEYKNSIDSKARTALAQLKGRK